MSDVVVTSVNQASEKRLDVLRDESGKLLLTADQKKAVLERGRILVSASAGSGKTSTMVKRIILMISEFCGDIRAAQFRFNIVVHISDYAFSGNDAVAVLMPHGADHVDQKAFEQRGVVVCRHEKRASRFPRHS